MIRRHKMAAQNVSGCPVRTVRVTNGCVQVCPKVSLLSSLSSYSECTGVIIIFMIFLDMPYYRSLFDISITRKYARNITSESATNSSRNFLQLQIVPGRARQVAFSTQTVLCANAAVTSSEVK